MYMFNKLISETAELFFDSKFCTNETNLQINLNISKMVKENVFFLNYNLFYLRNYSLW